MGNFTIEELFLIRIALNHRLRALRVQCDKWQKVIDRINSDFDETVFLHDKAILEDFYKQTDECILLIHKVEELIDDWAKK